MRIDRLYALTLYLSERDRVSAKALAERFAVSERTIYRDVDALDLAGIPVVTYPGSGGGIGLMPGYRLEGGVFTKSELRDLASTLAGIAPILLGTDACAAAEKVGVLAGKNPEDDAVRIDLTGWDDRPGWRDTVTVLVQGIQEERAVRFRYTSLKGETVVRDVEPLRVFFQRSDWYLSAYCRLRDDYRWFSVMRIVDPEILKSTFDRKARLEADTGEDRDPTPRTTVTIAFTEKGVLKTRGVIDPADLVERDDGRLEGSVTWTVNDALFEYFLRLGVDVEILGPALIREEFRRRAEAIAALYSKKDET